MPRFLLAVLLLAAPLSAAPPKAKAKTTVLDALASTLAKDEGFSAAERAALLAELARSFGADGGKSLTPARARALKAATHAAVEGSFDQAPAAKIADVSYAAYHAADTGASPDAAQGIALYAYRKSVPADKIAEWAKGYTGLIGKNVAPDAAADMIRGALEGNWDSRTFDRLGQDLVKAAAKGVDQRALASKALESLGRGRAPKDLVGILLPKAARSARPKPKPAAKVKVKPKVYGAPAGTRMAKLWPPLHRTAKSYLGTPYVWGGTTREGIDCSGFTQATYTANDVPLPRVSRDQWKLGTPVEWKELRAGDLVFFDTMGHGLSHVGMMVDTSAGLKFMHASSSKGVMVADLEKNWFKTRYLGARRVVN